MATFYISGAYREERSPLGARLGNGVRIAKERRHGAAEAFLEFHLRCVPQPVSGPINRCLGVTDIACLRLGELGLDIGAHDLV